MKHLNLLIALFVVIGCAKNRGVEPLRNNVTEDWVEKRHFTGERTTERDVYFAKITVVKNSSDGGFTFVGNETDMKVGYFDFTKEKLQFKNIQGAYKGRESTVSSSPILFQWPITHHEAELQTVDGKTTNKEIDDDRKLWSAKNSFKINFSMPDVNEENTFFTGNSCFEVLSRRRVDNSLQLEPGYVSFVVEVLYRRMCPGMQEYLNNNSNYMVQYRYSFRKMEKNPDFKPWAYEGELDPKMTKFGYFQSVKEDLNPNDGLPKNTFLVNRWDPNKTHTYYFTKGFPEKYKYIFKDIFKKTNQVFIDAKLKTRFEVKDHDVDGKVREFGDLRYSFINLVEEIDESAPLGYGPSNANPFTGEIIAANLNVWSGFLSYYMKVLELSAGRKEGKFESSDLYKKMQELLKEPIQKMPTDIDPSTAFGKFYLHMITETTYGFPAANSYTHAPQSSLVQALVEKIQPVESSHHHLHTKLKSDFVSLPSLKGSDLGVEFKTSSFHSDRIFGSVNYQPLHERPLFANLLKHSTPWALDGAEMLKGMNTAIEQYHQKEFNRISMNKRGHCLLDMQESLAGVEDLLIDGHTKEELIHRILYRVAIHEFGHNLNLRHNFYGSVDKAHFPQPSVPVKDVNGNVVMENGQPKYYAPISSSVMDYHRLEHEMYSGEEWEPYDVAALRYAYSGGLLDEKINYLFCTDEHTLTSAMCNRFDFGTSPSEVVMSLIDAYENGYYTRNYRFGRAYWNTSDYGGRIFTSMMEMKQFLPFWKTALYESSLRDELKVLGHTKEESDEMILETNREMKKTLKLVMAFYQSVLQQSNSDKPFRSEYHLKTGALQRMGIGFDKQVAMYMLAGDDAIFYNPNRVMLYASFLSYQGEPEFARLMDKINENIVTQRVDMEPWFISFGRQLYAQSAMNYSNRDDESLINKMKVKKYSAKDLKDVFAVEPKEVVTLTALGQSLDIDYPQGEEVAIVLVNSYYFMVSKKQNPYAYDIFKNLKTSEDGGKSLKEAQLDLQELYYIYTYSTGGTP